jgi:hypothetical protein
MKPLKLGLWLIILLLGVALREAPEYATLTDDTSNDGDVVEVFPEPSQQTSLSNAMPQEVFPSILPILLVQYLQDMPHLLTPVRINPLEAGRGLLNLLSQQRE